MGTMRGVCELTRQMLRHVLQTLENRGDLMTCHREVNPVYELGAVLKYFNNRQPILFKQVPGSRYRQVIGGLFGDRHLFYEMMGTSQKERIFDFAKAVAYPGVTQTVSKAPVQDHVMTKNIDINKLFPLPFFHEHDSARYITAGIIVYKDPDSGNRYTSIRRFQVNGPDELNILVATELMNKHYRTLEKQGRPMEVAIILGYDYPFLLASQVPSANYEVDKYGIDSALRGESLELVKCKTVDLEVPAQAEIILEGKIQPDKKTEEGPFAELMGYYGGVKPLPIIELTAITHRENPIFQTSFPCREEHLANGLMREVELYEAVNQVADVKDVNVTISGGCRFHAVVAINKQSEGDGKTVILSSLGSNKDLKHVVVVDEDVDIYDHDSVEWTIATRFQGERDLVTVPNAKGSPLDPSNFIKGVTDKVGFDATCPLEDYGVDFNTARIPGYEQIDINKYFPDYDPDNDTFN